MARLSSPILLLDGGLGTNLEDLYGVMFSEKTPLWSGHLLISSPSTLLELQSAFAVAGADVILTATYQTSFFGFSKTPRLDGRGGVGYSRDEAQKYMRSAIVIARKAIDEGGRRDNGLLALSLGSLGAILIPSQEFTGAYPAQYDHWKGLYDFHLERIRVFTGDKTTWDQVDIVAFETLPVVREVRAVREVMGKLEREGVRRRFWVSCVFPNEDLRLPDGTAVEELVQEMVRPGLPQPHAIGLNCTKLHLLRPLIAQFENALATHLPASTTTPHLVFYPDGAEELVYNTATRTWEPAVGGDGGGGGGGGEDTALRKPSWDEKVWEVVREVEGRKAWKGVLVGGCCKTSPEHIRRLRGRIDGV